MEFHEIIASSGIPLMDDGQLDELADSIRERGLLQPITLFESKILDGRCRYLACVKAGVKPRFKLYTGDDPAGFVAGMNLHRASYTADEIALVTAKLEDLKRNPKPRALPEGLEEVWEKRSDALGFQWIKVVQPIAEPDDAMWDEMIPGDPAGHTYGTRYTQLCELANAANRPWTKSRLNLARRVLEYTGLPEADELLVLHWLSKKGRCDRATVALQWYPDRIVTAIRSNKELPSQRQLNAEAMTPMPRFGHEPTNGGENA